MLAERLRQTFGVSTAAAVFLTARSAYAEPPPEFQATGGETTGTVTEMGNIPVQTNIKLSFEVANDTPPPLKPLEVCEEAERNTSESARDIATSDENFTNVRSWSSTPEAADILRYRLCTEEELVSEDGDSILRDTMHRLEHADWLPDVLLPFFEANPGFFHENFRYTNFDNAQWAEGENRYLNENRYQRIHYPKAVLLEAIKHSRSAALIIDRHYDEMQEAGSEYNEIALKIAEIHPVMTLSRGNLFSKVPGYTAPDNIEQIFLSAALKPENARTFIKQYEEYAYLPEAREIIKRAFNANPVYYYKSVIEDHSFYDLPREVREDETLKPSVESLKQAARKSAYILRYYQHFADLPEAMDIVRIAAKENTADVLHILGSRRSREDHPLRSKAEEIFTSADDIYRIATKWPATIISSYPLYKHLPEAQDILKTVANHDPARYFSHLRYALADDEITEDNVVIPDTEQLLASARIERASKYEDIHANDLLWGYKFYSHLPEARDIAKTTIEADPLSYFYLLEAERMPADLEADEFFPSVAALKATAEKGHLDFSDYKHYAHLPESEEILQILIDQNPVSFFSSLLSVGEGYGTTDYPALRPSPGVLKAWVQREALVPEDERRRVNHDLDRVLRYYPYFKDKDDADEIMRLVIDDSPKDAAFALSIYKRMQNPRGELSAELKEFYAEQDRGFRFVFKYLAENHRDFVTPGENSYISIDGLVGAVMGTDNTDPELVEIALDLIKERSIHALFFLAEPKNKDLINKLSPKHQQALLSIVTSATDHNIRDSYDLLRDILSQKGSWLAEPGRLPEELLVKIIKSSIERAPTGTITLLSERIDRLPISTESLATAIEEAVLQNSLTFLSHVTKNEKQADFVLDSIKVPYSEILKKAQETLTNLNKDEEGRYFYRGDVIDTLNNLHNYSMAERFALVKGRTPDFFAKLATRDDSSYYTSTFNYIIDQIISGLETDPEFKDRLLQGKITSLSAFIVNATHFGRVDDVLSTLSSDEVHHVTQTLINSSIGSKDKRDSRNVDDIFFRHRGEENKSILAATAVGLLSYMAKIGQTEEIESLLHTAFMAAERNEYKNMIGAVTALYMRATSSIDGFDSQNLKTPFFEKAAEYYMPSLANYLQTDMQAADLFDENNRHFQRMVFYNDEDGHNTFGHFKSMYRSDGRWKYRDHGKFISFNRSGIHVFANKPQHEEEGQKAIDEHIEKMGGTITSLIHRGHSYHVSKTSSEFLNEDTRFYWLGSCRSSSVWRYIDQAPEMQFIYSENIGAMRINDSILLRINNELAAGRDVNWLSIQDNALKISGGDRRVKSYVFPDGSYQYALRLSLSNFDADRNLTRTAHQEITEIIESEREHESQNAQVIQYPQSLVAVPSPH